MDKKKKGVIAVIAVILVIGIIAAIVIFVGGNKEGTKKKGSDNKAEETTYVEYPDVDKYFEENADVVSIVKVSESKEVMSEKDVTAELESRGFTDIAINTCYSIDGKYSEAEEIQGGNVKHPAYQTFYTTPNGDIWNISVVNSQITATPTSYLLESERATSIVVAETDKIVSYDSVDNRYFITVPHTDVMTVKVVDRVDAQTLDGLTAEEMD